MTDNYTITPGGRLSGELSLPGDKSISHRALMLGSIARGSTEIRNLLVGKDVLATMQAFLQMGVSITRQSSGLLIKGNGMHGLQAPKQVLDLENSGTALRLLVGLLAGQGWSVCLSGDRSLCSRPMNRVIVPLSRMAARIESDEGRAPICIQPQPQLTSIEYMLPVASAQVKSALLLAGLYAQGKTVIHEPVTTRDHTERMLRTFGYPLEREGGRIEIEGGGELSGCVVDVPADLSSAAFFILAALIMPDSEILLRDVGINPTRIGVITILRRMGGRIEQTNLRQYGEEPVADIRVSWSRLTGCHIDGDDVALAIDELPAIAVAAACAQGETVISGAQELRVKESDRIQSIVAGLRALSIEVEEKPDGMLIKGGRFKGGVVDSYSDHRIAMAFSVAGAVANAQVEVLDCANVATSFPGFQQTTRRVGIRLDD